MFIKEKIAGAILVIVGALPFLLKIDKISSFFSESKFLSFMLPGEIGYQLLIILIGIFLVWKISDL